MTLVFSGTIRQITFGRLWWKKTAWVGFCGCGWRGHAWLTEEGASAELSQHQRDDHVYE